jgi:hypothetical protein
MDLNERTIVYGLIAACIFGIIIVGAFIVFVGGTIFGGQGFSELYFQEYQKLPAVINEGEPLNFSFTVASHNNENMYYTYNIITGDKIINSGSFILPKDDNSDSKTENKYNKTIFVDDVKLKSTLILLNTSQISETKFSYNGGLGLLLSPDGQNGQVVTDSSRLYYPVPLPVGGARGTLVFNPIKQETFITTTNSYSKVGDVVTVSQDPWGQMIHGQRISNTGYDFSQSEWIITNEHGVISASAKTITSNYRYAFNRISVELNSSSLKSPDKITKYEIHFWVIVATGTTQLDVLKNFPDGWQSNQ